MTRRMGIGGGVGRMFGSMCICKKSGKIEKTVGKYSWNLEWKGQPYICRIK